MNFLQQLYDERSNAKLVFAEKESATAFVDDLFDFLFAPRVGINEDIEHFKNIYTGLKSHLTTLVYDVNKDGDAAQRISDTFFQQLPFIYGLLLKDAKVIAQQDPAAESIEEVFLTYPGFFAISVYRIAHALWLEQVKVLPRIFTEYAHSKTGIDIHPGATIGESFFIDHGTGIVIGETAVVGDNVRLYQGVTLGALHSSQVKRRQVRHPQVGDNVIIYSSATLLGDISIGENSIIGGNVWLTYSVPADSLVYHKSEVIARKDFNFSDAVNEILNGH